MNHTLDKIAIASGTAPQIGQQEALAQGLAAFVPKPVESATATAMAGAKEQTELQDLERRLAL